MAARNGGWMLVFALLLSGCGRGDVERTAMAMTGGDPERAPQLIRKYGCHVCHTIPGVQGARGMVGPPLGTIANRSYLAGNVPNTPENLMKWITDPQAIEPGTAMPDVGVTEQEARDIAAYLYTLR
jgi:cytochrome c